VIRIFLITVQLFVNLISHLFYFNLQLSNSNAPARPMDPYVLSKATF